MAFPDNIFFFFSFPFMNPNRPVFAEYINNSALRKNDAILTVFGTGEVFLIYLEADHNKYKVSNYATTSKYFMKMLESDSKESEFLRKLYNTKHIVANVSLHNNISCIGSFQPVSIPNLVKIEYVKEMEYLIVSGMVYKRVPSVGIFQVTSDSLSLLFVDSLFGLSDLTFSKYMHCFIALPRLTNSFISLFNPQKQRTEEGKFEHRLIPEIYFGGSNMKRTTHLAGGAIHKIHALSWNDEICPTIITWNFSPPSEPDKYWNCNEYDFLVPCFIHHVAIDSSSEKIGFIMEQNEKVFFCVWDIENNQVKQYNFEVTDIMGIRNTKWIRSIICSQMVYAVSADNGYYEHHINEIKKWENPLYDISTICCDENGDRFYFNEEGSLEFISCCNFYERVNLISTNSIKSAPIPIIHNQMNDICDNLTCIHMYRCAKCRRPLLYPLAAFDAKTNTKACYCSHDCFKEHWPSYIAVRQNLDFEVEKNDESKQ